MPYPKGPRSQIIGFLGPSTINIRVVGLWVLGPLRLVIPLNQHQGPEVYGFFDQGPRAPGCDAFTLRSFDHGLVALAKVVQEVRV